MMWDKLNISNNDEHLDAQGLRMQLDKNTSELQMEYRTLTFTRCSLLDAVQFTVS